MATGRGGKRPGAGRKPKAVRFASKRAAADAVFAAELRDAARQLCELGRGGLEVVERRMVPAGLVTVEHDELVESDTPGEPPELKRRKRLAFPDLDPAEPVCIETKTSRTLPDRFALVYICNRILGRPFAEPPPAEAADVVPALRDVVAEMVAEAESYERDNSGGAGEVSA